MGSHVWTTACDGAELQQRRLVKYRKHVQCRRWGWLDEQGQSQMEFSRSTEYLVRLALIGKRERAAFARQRPVRRRPVAMWQRPVDDFPKAARNPTRREPIPWNCHSIDIAYLTLPDLALPTYLHTYLLFHLLPPTLPSTASNSKPNSLQTLQPHLTTCC